MASIKERLGKLGREATGLGKEILDETKGVRKKAYQAVHGASDKMKKSGVGQDVAEAVREVKEDENVQKVSGAVKEGATKLYDAAKKGAESIADIASKGAKKVSEHGPRVVTSVSDFAANQYKIVRAEYQTANYLTESELANKYKGICSEVIEKDEKVPRLLAENVYAFHKEIGKQIPAGKKVGQVRALQVIRDDIWKKGIVNAEGLGKLYTETENVMNDQKLNVLEQYVLPKEEKQEA